MSETLHPTTTANGTDAGIIEQILNPRQILEKVRVFNILKRLTACASRHYGVFCRKWVSPSFNPHGKKFIRQ